MVRPVMVIAVAVGGALGSLARYGAVRLVQAQTLSSFPLGTLAVNLVGCLAIGFCYVWLDQRGSPAFRDFVRVGLLGGLTTFSSYCIESLAMMEKGQYALATLNIIGSVVGGLAAAVIGIAIGRAVFPT